MKTRRAVHLKIEIFCDTANLKFIPALFVLDSEITAKQASKDEFQDGAIKSYLFHCCQSTGRQVLHNAN
jgi:hypothetical protein